MLFLIEMRFEIDFPAALLGDNQPSIAVAYALLRQRATRGTSICGQSLWREC
jgi:hypothetical protein